MEYNHLVILCIFLAFITVVTILYCWTLYTTMKATLEGDNKNLQENLSAERDAHNKTRGVVNDERNHSRRLSKELQDYRTIIGFLTTLSPTQITKTRTFIEDMLDDEK